MIRVDDDVRRVKVPAQDHAEVQALIYDMNDRQRKDFEEFLGTDFSFEVLSMDTPGMDQVFRDIPMLPPGLVLVTRPTGSGKSTTRVAMIDFINDNRYDHILTIEEPIEFVHESKRYLVNQR